MKSFSRIIFTSSLLVTHLPDAFSLDYLKHQVRKGESLMTISYKHYGTHQKWRNIRSFNPEVSPSELQVGDTIRIPYLKGRVTKEAREVSLKNSYASNDTAVSLLKPEVINPNEMKQLLKSPKKAARVKAFKAPSVLRLRPSKRVPAAYISNGPTEKQREVAHRKASKLSKELESELVSLREDLFFERKQVNHLQSEVSKYKAQTEVFSAKAFEDLIDENKQLKKKMMTYHKQKNSYKAHPFQTQALASETLSDLIREKGRILSVKLWNEKNKEANFCRLSIDSQETSSKKKLAEFITVLNDYLGEDNVYIDYGNNEVVAVLNGHYVYGLKRPVVTEKAKTFFYHLLPHLNNVSFKKIHITATSRHIQTIEDGKKFSDLFFTLSQAKALESFLEHEVGIHRKILSSGSLGKANFGVLKGKKGLLLHFQARPLKSTPERALASVQELKVLSDYSKELKTSLGEPRYFTSSINDEGLSLSLGRSYFFSTDSLSLSSRGKNYLDTLVDLLSQMKESSFQVGIAPSFSSTNRTDWRLKKELEVLRNYIKKKNPWFASKIEFILLSSIHRKVASRKYDAEKLNNRVFFKALPHSLNIRKAQFFKDSSVFK